MSTRKSAEPVRIDLMVAGLKAAYGLVEAQEKKMDVVGFRDVKITLIKVLTGLGVAIDELEPDVDD